jgi:hypothetical protein
LNSSHCRNACELSAFSLQPSAFSKTLLTSYCPNCLASAASLTTVKLRAEG